MAVVLLALSASLFWGVADFLGGAFSRRLPAPVVVIGLETGGLVGVVLFILVRGEPAPDGRSLLYAAIGGICGTLGLVAFFRAMALGSMAVVTPVFAAGAASIPAIVGVATGDTLGTVVAAGLILAAAGITLASLEGEHAGPQRARDSRSALGFALLGACGAATYVVCSDAASDGSVSWTLLVARAAALPVIALGVAVTRTGPVVPARADVAALAAIGLVDLLATACFGLANTKGALVVVAVLGSMYPVITAGLARLVLKERVRRIQLAGVACALAGVVLVAAG